MMFYKASFKLCFVNPSRRNSALTSVKCFRVPLGGVTLQQQHEAKEKSWLRSCVEYKRTHALFPGLQKKKGERGEHGDRGQMINSLTLRWLTFLPSDAIHWQYFKMTDSGPCVKRYIIDLPFNPVRISIPRQYIGTCMRARTHRGKPQRLPHQCNLYQASIGLTLTRLNNKTKTYPTDPPSYGENC